MDQKTSQQTMPSLPFVPAPAKVTGPRVVRVDKPDAVPEKSSETAVGQQANIPEQTGSPESNHFSAGIMWRIDPEIPNHIQFLVMDYTQEGRRTTTKFPGGTNRVSKEPPLYWNETPFQTVLREWAAEVGHTISDAEKKPAYMKPVGKDHRQFFFIFHESDVSSGDLRTEEKKEEEVGSPPELLGPPYWVSEKNVWRKLTPAHLAALEAAMPAIHKAFAAMSNS